MGESQSKPKVEKLAFNNLPSLVKQWDKTQQDQIESYQKSVMERSALSMSMSRKSFDGFKIKTEGTTMIKNYLPKVFEDGAEDDKRTPLLQGDQQRTSLKKRNDMEQPDEEFSINEDHGSTERDGGRGKNRTIREDDENEDEETSQNYGSYPEADGQKLKHAYKENEEESKQTPGIYDNSRTGSFYDTLQENELKNQQKQNNSSTPKLKSKADFFIQKLINVGIREGRKTLTTKDQLAGPPIIDERKEEVKQKTYERARKFDKDQDLKITRDQMLTNVCSIIFKHIEAAEKFIESPTQAALLFHEYNFVRHEWYVYSQNGYSATLPMFLYVLEDVEYVEKPVAEGDLILFMRRIFEKMQLATECIIISLIYLERIMLKGGLEIRYCNWKPLVFTAVLLASKFWEDINFWNADYAEAMGWYPLKSINRMESEFVSLCQYNLFVSAEMYTQYLKAMRDLVNPIMMKQSQKPFNRFKASSPEESGYLSQLNNKVHRIDSPNSQSANKPAKGQAAGMPVFYTRNESVNYRGPQYPALQVDVNMYVVESKDITAEMAQGLNNQRNQSISMDYRQSFQQSISKIKKMLFDDQDQTSMVFKHDDLDDEEEIEPYVSKIDYSRNQRYGSKQFTIEKQNNGSSVNSDLMSGFM